MRVEMHQRIFGIEIELPRQPGQRTGMTVLDIDWQRARGGPRLAGKRRTQQENETT
jgi:hypothetical protein